MYTDISAIDVLLTSENIDPCEHAAYKLIMCSKLEHVCKRCCHRSKNIGKRKSYAILIAFRELAGTTLVTNTLHTCSSLEPISKTLLSMEREARLASGDCHIITCQYFIHVSNTLKNFA